LHLLVEVKGDLIYKRPGWKEYLPLSFGTALNRGDLVQVAIDAEGLVVCTDLSLAQVSSGYHGGLPCPQAEPIMMRGESLMVGPRRGTPPVASIPYVLSPRHTFILTSTPMLRWRLSSTGVVTYTVRVWGGSVDWQMETPATELIYPGDAPSLEPRTPYHLVVVDSGGHSSTEEKTPLDLSFVLLSPGEIETVKALVALARGLRLNGWAIRFVEAEIYASRGLRADAIALLEELARTEDAPAIPRRLGDLYLEVGLYTEARDVYKRALEGYRTLGDKYGEAHVLTGLGLAYRGDRDEATARDYLKQALSVYQAVGDADGGVRAKKVLAELK